MLRTRCQRGYSAGSGYETGAAQRRLRGSSAGSAATRATRRTRSATPGYGAPASRRLQCGRRWIQPGQLSTGHGSGAGAGYALPVALSGERPAAPGSAPAERRIRAIVRAHSDYKAAGSPPNSWAQQRSGRVRGNSGRLIIALRAPTATPIPPAMGLRQPLPPPELIGERKIDRPKATVAIKRPVGLSYCGRADFPPLWPGFRTQGSRDRRFGSINGVSGLTRLVRYALVEIWHVREATCEIRLEKLPRLTAGFPPAARLD